MWCKKCHHHSDSKPHLTSSLPTEEVRNHITKNSELLFVKYLNITSLMSNFNRLLDCIIIFKLKTIYKWRAKLNFNLIIKCLSGAELCESPVCEHRVQRNIFVLCWFFSRFCCCCCCCCRPYSLLPLPRSKDHFHCDVKTKRINANSQSQMDGWLKSIKDHCYTSKSDEINSRA